MSDYALAQLNIAQLIEPLDSPRVADFVANLDRINALAESSQGFVWRLKTDDGNATEIRPFGDEYIVNLSVWADMDALYNYVYRSGHVEIMRRRKEWFSRMKDAYMVLWWVPAGHNPTAEEARAKLQTLREHGPTAEAFTFKQPFPRPNTVDGLPLPCRAGAASA